MKVLRRHNVGEVCLHEEPLPELSREKRLCVLPRWGLRLRFALVNGSWHKRRAPGESPEIVRLAEYIKYTTSHLYIYQRRPDIFGIVHRHSLYATAFAALGKPIPVYLTAQGDEAG